MDSNIIYYVAAILDPQVKTSFIRAQMSKSDTDVIVSDIHEYLKKQYPASPTSSSSAERLPANAFNYSLMLKAVQDYLPIPSAEVGVERLFSNAQDVLGIRRHCLNSETFRWLIFLKGQYGKEHRDSA
ncbi:hypothetical protein TSTA_081350 [Talaromyces stipitatus ATCC 10500]|uniref:HAT C-terminal dimerisation domain-containing protein n=1 Tax=Talaromyces stipitatus (strain ATCC 10500 / CBS 375.48 / QM 6759 / NRRL 1006) TaxID=441959 RepID=B8LZX0_TALSN|nr:uncharacterized protein TSTA_081350 [Talaromyces stipitatus ATCC 10500]EED20902.1 hypothetical protein TSTA_081350 [Talaromyces stipitatus ATCC 10500]